MHTMVLFECLLDNTMKILEYAHLGGGNIGAILGLLTTFGKVLDFRP